MPARAVEAPICPPDVKITLSAFDSCDQRCLGLRDPALKRDEGRIVERSAHGIRAVLAF